MASQARRLKRAQARGKDSPKKHGVVSANARTCNLGIFSSIRPVKAEYKSPIPQSLTDRNEN